MAAALAFNSDRNDEAVRRRRARAPRPPEANPLGPAAAVRRGARANQDHLIAVVDVGATLNLTVILASNGIYRVRFRPGPVPRQQPDESE